MVEVIKIPTKIERRSESMLVLTYAGEPEYLLAANLLRKQCPCALCREQRGDGSHAKPLTAGKSLLKVIEHTADEATRLEQVWSIGNYAIGMRWGDGHDDGIFTWPYLWELACGQSATPA